jgi:OmcA/MtrC family decaheme c-type cytochrome
MVAASLTSAPKKHVFSTHEKAFYADAATVEYVNPGLTITINSATITTAGVITVVYTVTDPNGIPLDTAGVNTPGKITLSYLCDVLPNGQDFYKSYITRTSSGTAITNQVSPTSDSGGVATQLAPGQYQYVYHNAAPAGFDATATHTIGIYGNRNLTAYSLPTNYDSATFNFVPNGAKVTHVEDIIETASCNTCHDQLSFHGGSRRGLNMCVLCHNPGFADPNTGASLDAKVLYHKIHMGYMLPSVVAGTPYVPTSGNDFSNVKFPADPFDPRRCETCHSQTTGAANAKAFMTKPNRLACGACHDNVNFATGANHAGGIQNDDNQCSTCHQPQGEMDFDASIMGAHVAPTASTLLNGINAVITGVTGGTAGKAPTVAFTLTDNNKNAIPLTLSGLSISFTMAGPTTDYGTTNFGSDVTTPGYVTESATKATCSAAGACTYTFTHVVPAKATGTYAIGVEARRTDTVPELINGATVQTAIEYGAPNQVTYFSVDGSPIVKRRAVVALANCNQCHVALQIHGALRNNTEYCVMCHNPSNTDASTRATATVAADKAAPPQGINFNLLVHRIHDGINMQASNRTYVVVGYGGSHNDFSGILFPAMSPTGVATDLANCSLCHINTTEQNDLALSGLNPVTDPQGPLNPDQPFTAACTGCHVDIPTASHALSNTNVLGEACNVCHGSGAAYSVSQVHAQY